MVLTSDEGVSFFPGSEANVFFFPVAEKLTLKVLYATAVI